MAQAGQRKCMCCREFFTPDCRNMNRQKYCSKPDCRLCSKAASQLAWLSKPQNSDYFRSPVHVERVRAWRAAHPDYSAGKPPKQPKPKALQDGLITQANDFIEETAIRTEKPGADPDTALQDLLNGSAPVLAGLIAHLFDLTLQEDIASTTRRLIQMGHDLIDRSHRHETPKASAAP